MSARTILDRPFWHVEADPHGERAYDWEEWASDTWLLEHWAPAALRRITDGRQLWRLPRWVNIALSRVIGEH